MKSKELIKQLQDADPTGEVEVFCPSGDIHFVENLPWYYDGRPGKLIRDHSNPYYNIVGIKQVTEEDKSKIYIHTLDLQDVAWESWDDNNNEPTIFEGDKDFLKLAEGYKQEAVDCNKKICFNAFKEFILKSFNSHTVGTEEIQKFFDEYEDKLWQRRRFNSFGSSIRDKEIKYWTDCVQFQENGLTYIEGFEGKDYNTYKNMEEFRNRQKNE